MAYLNAGTVTDKAKAKAKAKAKDKAKANPIHLYIRVPTRNSRASCS